MEWKDKRLPAYEVIKAILATLGKDVGSARWYNRLRGLYVLRNLAVHYYPEHRPTGTWPDDLEPYVTNHTIEPGGDDSMDWTSRILISSVAEQALCIAFDAVRGFDSEVA